LPVRFTFDNNYFNDRYQGIPIGGYNHLTNGLLAGTEVRTNTDFFSDRSYWLSQARRTIFTGKIDAWFGYRLGELEYRTLRFEHELLEQENYQGIAQMNYTDAEVPFTRIIEHKHFEFGRQPVTVITREYSTAWTPGSEPYYPVNDDRNSNLFRQYRSMADKEHNVIFGGRLAEYRYYDMHQVIASALTAVKKEFDR
jgi:UDP-galactopyranose mutase